jgi:hypothetical protein
MAHPRAAMRFFASRSDIVTNKSNELEWKKALEMADAVFQEQLFALEEQGEKVEKRCKGAKNSDIWTREHAVISIEAAHYDLGVARGALADGNAPGFERELKISTATIHKAIHCHTTPKMTRLRSWILPSGAKKNRLLRRVALIKGWQLAEVVSHGFKEEIRRKRYSTGCRSYSIF